MMEHNEMIPEYNDADEFRGGVTYKQAEDLLLRGWPEGRRKLGAITHASGFSEKQSNNVFDLIESVSGSMVDMGKYLSGEPECMLEFTAGRSDKLVSILYAPKLHKEVSSNAIFMLGAYLMQAIDSLEADGYRTEIIYRFGVNGERAYAADIYITLKTFTSIMDEDFLTFCLCHPAFLRCLLFCYMGKMKLRDPAKLNDHLGYPCSATDKEKENYDIVIEDLVLYSELSTKESIEKCFGKYNLHLTEEEE
jgi:hypothetical protein